MKNLKTFFILFPVIIASCVKPLHLTVNYSDDVNSKGKINIFPSRSIPGTSLTMNGKLLVEQQYVKKITVQNLPDGVYSYHLTCNSSKLKDKVDAQNQCFIQNGNEQSILVETPPISNGYWINTGLYSLGSWAALIVYLLSIED